MGGEKEKNTRSTTIKRRKTNSNKINTKAHLSHRFRTIGATLYYFVAVCKTVFIYVLHVAQKLSFYVFFSSPFRVAVFHFFVLFFSLSR